MRSKLMPAHLTALLGSLLGAKNTHERKEMQKTIDGNLSGCFKDISYGHAKNKLAIIPKKVLVFSF